MNNLIPNDKYKEILDSMPICCADIIIHYNNKVLLVKRKNHASKGEWWIPGGRVLKNEKLKDAALRKIKQETGLSNFELKEETTVHEYFSKDGIFPDLKTGTHNIGVIFIASIKDNQEIKLDNQGSEFKWIDKIEEDLSPEIKKILSDSKIFN